MQQIYMHTNGTHNQISHWNCSGVFQFKSSYVRCAQLSSFKRKTQQFQYAKYAVTHILNYIHTYINKFYFQKFTIHVYYLQCAARVCDAWGRHSSGANVKKIARTNHFHLVTYVQ